MRAAFHLFIDAPIDDVFAFFDDPAKTLVFQEHAKEHLQSSEVVEVQPDGRRTFDYVMRAGPTTWTQTIQQQVREAPTRQVARSWTWTKDRNTPLTTITTDRHFTVQGRGTIVDVVVEFRAAPSWRRPLWIVLNRLWGVRAFKLEQEHALHNMAEYLEGRHRAASLD